MRVQHLLLAAVSIGAAESSLQEQTRVLPVAAPKAQRSEVLRGCWSALKRVGLGPRTTGHENCSDGTSAAPPVNTTAPYLHRPRTDALNLPR